MIDFKIKINKSIPPVDSSELKPALDKSMKQLMMNYGIESSFKLNSDYEELNTGQIILIEVNSKRIWSPVYLSCQCWYYVHNSHVKDLKTDSEILDEIKKEKDKNIILKFLENYVVESCKLSIQDFVNDDVIKELKIESKIPLKKITSIVKELLNVHISINKYKDRFKKEINADTFTEDIIQEVRAKQVTVYFSRKYFLKLVNQFDEWGEGKIFRTVDELLFYELGFDFPDVKFSFKEIPDGYFQIKINDYETGLLKGLDAGECIIQKESSDNTNCIIHPASNAKWLRVASGQNENSKFATLYPFSFIGSHLINLYRRFSYLLINKSMVENLLNELEYTHSELLSTLKSKRDIDFICKVFRALLEEGISIRNFESIFQSIIDFDYLKVEGMNKIIFDWRLTTLNEPDENWKNDPEIVAEFVRLNLKNYISSKLSNSSYSLNVFLLDPQIEKIVVTKAQFTEDIVSKLINEVNKEVESSGKLYNPIITTIEVRKKIKKIIAKRFPGLPVTSYQELNPNTNIIPITRIYLDELNS